MIITHKLHPMDLTYSGATQRVDVVQDDKYSRNLEFTLTQNGIAWPIPAGATAIVRYKKSDGHGGNYDTLPDGITACAVRDNVITVALAPQVCTAPGVVLLAVGLILGNAEINTFSVNIVVHQNPGINVLSEDYINVHLISRIEDLETAVSALDAELGKTVQEQQEALDKLAQDVADLKYVPIKITSLGCNPNVVEIGSTVAAVTLSWGVNKTPTELTLDGAALDSGATNTRLDGLGLTGNKTWTLRAVDERGTVAAANASITYLNGVYYGAAAAPDMVDSVFILSLSKTLRSSKLPSFTVNAGAGQYIWYCVPSRFGVCRFKVGGFDGGFDRVAVLEFTNASGYTESYDVYRSANAELGNTTVGVS